MRLVGLTGGFASGKSSVAAILRSLGATVLDADAIYHDLIAPLPGGKPSPLAESIEARFPGILGANGALNRKRLGERIFTDPDARAALGAITHPAVALAAAEATQKAFAAGADLVIYDVPLLFENGLETGMAGVIVVWVPENIQIDRLIARDQLSPAEAAFRVRSQMPLDQKKSRATWVIDNSGTPEATERAVREVWEQVRRTKG